MLFDARLVTGRIPAKGITSRTIFKIGCRYRLVLILFIEIISPKLPGLV
jgi:hypothetical protein